MKNKKFLFIPYLIIFFSGNLMAENPDQQVKSCMNPILGEPQGAAMCCGLYKEYDVQGCCAKFAPEAADACVAQVNKLIATSGQPFDFSNINVLVLKSMVNMLTNLQNWLKNQTIKRGQRTVAALKNAVNETTMDLVDQGQSIIDSVQSIIPSFPTSSL